MDNINQLRLEEYNSLSEKYRQLEEIVVKLLGDGLKNGGIRTLQIEHRIKGAESAIGKLGIQAKEQDNRGRYLLQKSFEYVHVVH